MFQFYVMNKSPPLDMARALDLRLFKGHNHFEKLIHSGSVQTRPHCLLSNVPYLKKETISVSNPMFTFAYENNFALHSVCANNKDTNDLKCVNWSAVGKLFPLCVFSISLIVIPAAKDFTLTSICNSSASSTL